MNIESICKEYNTKNINYICQKYNIRNYTINDDDGTVDVDDNVNLCNKGLTQLPLKFGRVNGYFDCGRNHLTSLEGSPQYVEEFYCSNNELKTLEEGPKIVLVYYSFHNNKLINFKGFPEDFDGNISIFNNPVYKKLENIPVDKHNKFIYWCNEFDAITDDGKVIIERMEEVYNKLGIVYEY